MSACRRSVAIYDRRGRCARGSRERWSPSREPPFAWRRRRSADEDEREHAIGVVECEQLREGSAGRDADHVRSRDPVRVEDADRVGDQVGACVFRAPRLRCDRSARVPVVVADHEASSLGQQPAEPLVPPEHRCPDTHDQEDWRGGGTAEGLRTELDVVCLDHALGHVHAFFRCAGSVISGEASVPTDRGDALAASGGSANAIAFPSGSGTFT
jgi:hypothetical protein